MIGEIAEDQPFAENFLRLVDESPSDEIEIEIFEPLWVGLEVMSPINTICQKAKDSLYADVTGEGRTICLDELEKTTKLSDEGWIVFFQGRRTGTCVNATSRSEAISKARKSKKRGGNKVVSARKMNASEKKTANAGKWVKSRPPGFKPSMRGVGPKPKAAS